MKRYIGILSALWIIFCVSCSEQDRIDYFDTNAPAPAQITDIKLVPIAGGAVITYQTPLDPNLLYVKAQYETQSGLCETKASYYNDTIFVEGFGDTLQHEVKLYSVGKNEKASEPVVVNFKPLNPPIYDVFNDLDFRATFGGIRVDFTNVTKANLAIVIMEDTARQDHWTIAHTIYTSAASGFYSLRGFSSVEREYAIYIRDRWNNKSDTLIKTLLPLYEEEVSKSNFRAMNLPNDTYEYVQTYDITHLWDDGYECDYDIFATRHDSEIPQWFTIDLGVKVILSRMKEFQRAGYEYRGAAVKKFEIWGSNNPNLDGSWDSWTFLSEFESYKPSGTPLGTKTTEDINYASVNGEDFEFPILNTAYRYIRFKTTETYEQGSGQVVIAELAFWGQIED